MERSFPFNAVVTDGVPDRVYTAEDFAAERAAFVSDGVLSGAGAAVQEIIPDGERPQQQQENAASSAALPRLLPE